MVLAGAATLKSVALLRTGVLMMVHIAFSEGLQGLHAKDLPDPSMDLLLGRRRREEGRSRKEKKKLMVDVALLVNMHD